MRKIISNIFIYTFIFALSVNNCIANKHSNDNVKPVKNVILMIGDGFAPAGATLARYVKGGNLNIDSILVGSLQTKSADSLITDSAAAATALATGYKTNNKVISKDPLTHDNLKSILYAAQNNNMSTGVVTTDKITGATIASFSANSISRNLHQEIAVQQLNSDIDVMLGGGYKYFLPKSQGGKRKDKRNLLNEAKAQGIKVINNKSDLQRTNQTPVIGLFSNSEMSFTLDQKNNQENTEPTLYAMTEKAIELLSNNTNGFLLIVEGARIDHAAHNNDAAAYAHEILAYDETIKLVMDYIDTNPETMLISTADHGTGGVTVGADVGGITEYIYNPSVLSKVRHSIEYLDNYLKKTRSIDDMITQIGISNLSTKEINRIKYNDSGSNHDFQAIEQVRNIISEKSRTGWTTAGHTAVDINLYSYGDNSKYFAGNHDNTVIAKKIATLLKLDIKQ